MKITYSSSLSKHRLVKENNVKCYHQMKLLQAKVPKEGNNCYNLNLINLFKRLHHMNIKSIKCLLIICLIFSIKGAFANENKICESKLIIGSGKNVQSFYPSARKVNNCDITIDKNKKLNPLIFLILTQVGTKQN
jgi:hypothetical protein